MYLHPGLSPLTQGPHSAPADPDLLNLTDTFPHPFSTGALGIYFRKQVSIQRLLNPHKSPLNGPIFQNPCPLSNLFESLERHQLWVARIGGRVRACGCNPYLQESPCLFICPAWSAVAPGRPLFCPPRRLISEQGEDGQERTYGSKQSVVARHRGKKLRFLLPSPTPQEFRVISFPPGEDSTAVFPWGFPGPKNLPRCSSASKGIPPYRPPGKEQKLREPTIPGSKVFIKRPRGMEGNPVAWEHRWVKDFPVYQARLPPPHRITWCLEV